MNNTFTQKNLDNFKSSVLDWNQIQLEMKSKLGVEVYESWLKKIDFIEEFNNYLLLSVPTRFIRDWITSRYLDQILQTIKNHKKEIIRIEFKIIENKDNNFANSIKKNKVSDVENISFITDAYLQYNRIDPNKRFENFLIGSKKIHRKF